MLYPLAHSSASQGIGFYGPDCCGCSTACSESASARRKKVLICIWRHQSGRIPTLTGESGKCTVLHIVQNQELMVTFCEDEQEKRTGISTSIACSPEIPLHLIHKVFIQFSSCWRDLNPTRSVISKVAAATVYIYICMSIFPFLVFKRISCLLLA